MKANNMAAFQKVAAIVAEESHFEKSDSDGLMLIAIYKKKKKATVKVHINGLDMKEADVILRDIYSKVYEIRKRNDPKAQKLNEKLEGKKNRV